MCQDVVCVLVMYSEPALSHIMPDRFYVGVPLGDLGGKFEFEKPSSAKLEDHQVPEYHTYSGHVVGFDVQKINNVVQEHGASQGVYFEYSDAEKFQETHGRYTNLSIFSYDDDSEYPIALENFQASETQNEALRKCARILLDEPKKDFQIGLYSADSSGWRMFKQ